MSIAPINCEVEVGQSPAEAFELFTTRIGEWWPGQTIGEKPHASITIEPRPEGRWFETDADGKEAQWGKVLAYDPPARLLLAWQLNSQFRYDPGFQTEVEITFTPTASGGTRVALEHRDLERFGDDAARVAGQIRDGWPEKIAGFADFAATHGKEMSR